MFLLSVNQRRHGAVEADAETKPAGWDWKPVLQLVWVCGLGLLEVERELAVLHDEVAVLVHVAVHGVTIDLVVYEVAVWVVHRDFPELCDRRKIAHIECHHNRNQMSSRTF